MKKILIANVLTLVTLSKCWHPEAALGNQGYKSGKLLPLKFDISL